MSKLKIFTIVSSTAIMFLMLSTSLTVVASDGQNPNRQIVSSNTSTDTSSWLRMSMITNQPFDYSSSNNNFTFQMNTLLNGGTNSCYCSFTWWLQGVVQVENSYSGSAGAFVGDAFNEVWNGVGDQNFCYLFPSPVPNINQTGYATVQQTTLTSTSQITYELTVINANGVNVYSNSQTCNDPSGYSSIDYFTQEEGVIVGDCCGNHVSFTPLSSTIFYGYIDMVSNYNLMSSSSQTTQTGESSNLYQDVTNYYGETYGSMYLYTVMSNENTTTTT